MAQQHRQPLDLVMMMLGNDQSHYSFFRNLLTIVSSSKMIWMEKQLESLTELVKELTRERNFNEQQLSSRTGFCKGISRSKLLCADTRK